MEHAVNEKNAVTTATVKRAIECYIADRHNHFTTADIARLMDASEYQVRASFTWLTRYGVIEIIPNARSKRFLGKPKDPSRRRHASSYTASLYRLCEQGSGDEVDFNRLMGVFCRG